MIAPNKYELDGQLEFPVIVSGVSYTNVHFNIIKNERRMENLYFNGYKYRKEAAFKTAVNWVCTYPKCGSRCMTNPFENSIKFGKHFKHNHPKEFQ